MNDATSPEPSEGTKGIPDFWLNLLKSVDHLAEMVQEHDEPILKHLYDITVEIGTDPDVCFKNFLVFNILSIFAGVCNNALRKMLL